jgi:hypothetical protein
MTSLITNQNSYCEKFLQQKLCPYRTGPVYCEKSRDRVGSQHYCGHHLGGEWKEDHPMLYNHCILSTLSPFVVKMESDRYFAILSQQNYQRYRYCQR